ncbi:MAG: polyprenyl synthetase family protein [Chloroflexi bacterium]|nr:MAG: polyprenyl synthetase family protein [Chloroflexota bacterium]
MTTALQVTLLRHQREIQEALRRAVMNARGAALSSGASDLQAFYGQIEYHLGWVDTTFSPVSSNPGKLLRPTLLLLAYEASGAWGLTTSTEVFESHPCNPSLPLHSVQSKCGSGQAQFASASTYGQQGCTEVYLSRALPAAAAVELTHNFTLIHDDIEDGDTERRHRSTLWKIWGIPQAINTGDGLFALARLTLWGVLDEGVEGAIAARLGAVLDHACLVLAEGQYLDISFEERQDIAVTAYVDMTSRKTAALIACAAEMGAILGTSDEEAIKRLRGFGHAMGVAFQVRDDLLGVWATTVESGKTPAGDVYRRKKSLPFLYALEHAHADDKRYLREVYQQEAALTSEQVEEILTIFERTQTKKYCRSFLAEQCRLASEALASVPRTNSPVSSRAIDDMQTLVHFVEEASKE